MNEKNLRKAEIKKAFSNRLETIRKERDLSIEQFAELLNTTPATLGNYKKADASHVPQISDLILFAERLNVSPAFLLNLTDNKVFVDISKEETFEKMSNYFDIDSETLEQIYNLQGIYCENTDVDFLYRQFTKTYISSFINLFADKADAIHEFCTEMKNCQSKMELQGNSFKEILSEDSYETEKTRLETLLEEVNLCEERINVLLENFLANYIYLDFEFGYNDFIKFKYLLEHGIDL